MFRTSRRWFRSATALALAGLSLSAITACSGDTGSSGTTTAAESSAAAEATSAAAAEAVTISYWIWDKNQQPAIQQIADDFHAANPSITVTVELASAYRDYWTKLQTAATSGTAPDVFWMNGPNFQLYASNGQLEPLDDVFASSLSSSDYPQSLIDLYTYDGHQYGVPKDFDTVVLAYNSQLFADAGVAAPTDTWTWDDVHAAAQALTDPSKGIYGMFAGFYSQEDYYDTIYQAGGYVISADGKSSGYDQPEAIAGIQYWIDFIKDGSSPDYATMNDVDPDQSGVMLGNGTAAMEYIASYSAAAILDTPEGQAGHIKFARLPAGVQEASIIHGLGNVVYAQSAHKDAAKAFVAYLGSKAAADVQAETSTVIPAFNGTQDTWVASFPAEVNAQVFIDELPVTVPYPVSANTSAWANQESEILSKAWSLEQTPEEACAAMAKAMNEALAAE
ncbi:MAG: sugar ABC transporter substrate-binding protein [Propionibacteriaceae bacterium]|jgi:multiple sugar transport system substrate-binding protein|nr:sugar ABC transporter substrate-binding protein [Propionibacteriaceae bacterium]